MPVIVCKIDNNRNEHWESLILVSLQDIQEVIVLKETHGSICDLQVDTSNASHYSLEEFRNQMLNFVDFTDFQNFLKFSQEKSLFYAVGKWPILEESLKKRNCEGSIFGEEEHRAS